MKIDTHWFYDRITSKYKSIRNFAKLMRGKNGKCFDVASVSRMLHGERSMKVGEAKQIAKLLDEPLIEVVKRAGSSE